MSWADSASFSGFKFSQLEMSKGNAMVRHYFLANLTTSLHLEVVLSQIIPAFRFAPTGAEIVWRFGIISTPSVKGSVQTFRPKLPIMISRV